MKILYSLLAAGNGHLARAEEILPHLDRYGKVDVAVSGTDGQVKLPRAIDHRHHGLVFHLGKRGGIDYWRSLRDFKLPTLMRDIASFPIDQYDLVINDFEPVTCRSAKKAGVPIVSLSHQASFLSEETPRAAKQSPDLFAELILKRYAPAAASIGIHFQPYDHFIRTPVIRRAVRDLKPKNDGHIVVYLPAYDDGLLMDFFRTVPEKKWELFSKRSSKEFTIENIQVRPIDSLAYTTSLGACDGLLTGGGFEGPAEAMYLGKKVLCVPQLGQFEQRSNAEAARRLGVSVHEKINKGSFSRIADWAIHGESVHIDFEDNARSLVDEAMDLGLSRFQRSIALRRYFVDDICDYTK